MNVTHPIALPVTQGSKEHGFNSNILYDANGDSIAQLYGLPQSTSLEELLSAVSRGDFNGAWADGAERAAFIVKAVNAHDKLVEALRKLHHECLEAGFTQNSGYGWPTALSGAEAALAAAGEQV